MKLQLSLILSLIFSIYLSFCDNICEKTFEKKSKVSNSSETREKHSDYKVSSVENQFIVTFRGWYSDSARSGYISAALKTLSVHDDPVFSVIPRDNPMSRYPSDFDLIELRDSELVTRSLELLTRHPMVRSVTPQKMVTRFLASEDESEEEDISHEEEDFQCEDCQSSWVNGRRSLSLGSAFWHSPASHKGRKLLRYISVLSSRLMMMTSGQYQDRSPRSSRLTSSGRWESPAPGSGSPCSILASASLTLTSRGSR